MAGPAVSESQADENKCQHYFTSHVHQGMSIRLCMFCHEPDWGDFREQVLFHSEDTLQKVYKALRSIGLNSTQIVDSVLRMQNAGILFRENWPEQEGENMSMSQEMKTRETSGSVLIGESFKFQLRARQIVYDYAVSHQSSPPFGFELGDVYIVWFCKTLQNWKALLSTTIPDQMYYEVTYDGDRKQAYLDAYRKMENVTIQDE